MSSEVNNASTFTDITSTESLDGIYYNYIMLRGSIFISIWSKPSVSESYGRLLDDYNTYIKWVSWAKHFGINWFYSDLKRFEPSPGPSCDDKNEDTKPECKTRDVRPDNVLTMFNHVSAARGFLQATSLNLIPMLYGLLGATAYILRRLNEQIENYTLTTSSSLRYRLRMALGALLGFAIGLFVSPTSPQIPLTWSLSVSALAFLSGYSVEFVFSLLDAIVKGLRSSVSRLPEDTRGKARQSGRIARPGP